jgi:uncharacterized membrane protein (UPF0127 family)
VFRITIASVCSLLLQLACYELPGLMKKFWTLQLIASISMACGLARADETPQMNLQRITLTAGIHQIDTQVALTNEQRAVGLMYRNEMPQNEGMLFVFEQATVQCFWMKNTRLPLTAAFVADDGTIVNLENMKPQTTESHCSHKPVRYVLEMNQGWFVKKGIKPGSKLSGRPFSST